MRLTHIDEQGRAVMVDVSGKPETVRRAVARGRIVMAEATRRRILDGDVKKGDVLGLAEIAGIMAAKRTSDLIPLCHPLPLSHVRLSITPGTEPDSLEIEAECRTSGRTGVEMEALTAVTVAGLALYDMCKSIDRAMYITDIRLTLKDGGKSGPYHAP